METYKEWPAIKASCDVIKLLKLICLATYAGSATKKDIIAYLEAEEALLSYCQGRKQSVGDYFDAFRARAEVYIHAGGEPGSCQARIKVWLTKQNENEDTTD